MTDSDGQPTDTRRAGGAFSVVPAGGATRLEFAAKSRPVFHVKQQNRLTRNQKSDGCTYQC